MKPSMIGDEKDLAYFAGFVDGEGYIGIKKYIRNKKYAPMYSERISVGGLCERAIKSFNDLVQGYIYYHKPNKKSPNGFWTWEVTEDNARRFLTMILPYLRIKQLEAKIVLALGKNKLKTQRKKIGESDIKLRESLYIITKMLHKGDRYA